MAKIVIDIPDEEYEEIICDEACGLNTLTRAIAQGRVLPKGHGRLIDGDALKEKMKGTQRYFHIKYDIDEAPTIIEADKE